MIIVEKVNLSDKEQRQANELTERVQKADRTYSDFYLSNQFNYFQDMPTFILAYDENKLVGLTMLYADEGPEEEVEVNLEVDPEFRRQGIATRMFEHAKRIMVQYGYHKWEFVTEKVFLEKNPSFLKNMSLKVVPEDSDYYMRTAEPALIEKNDKLNQVLVVKPLTMNYVDQVAAAHSNAFGDAIATSTKYIKNSLLDKDTKSFILLKRNEVVGYCAVDQGENEDYFFGLFIDKPFRRQGFGTFFIKKMMVILQKEGSKAFALNADVSNRAAINVYLNVGFKILSETVYLKNQESI